MTGELITFGVGILIGAGLIAIVAVVGLDRYLRDRRR